MHYTHVVALPGDIDPEKLRDELNNLMDYFDENRTVPLHRDTSVYAEPYADVLAKAKASNRNNWVEGLSDDEIVQQWEGYSIWDTDGWPLTTHNPDGHWDWWVVGGRWAGAWTLREGAEDGPLETHTSEKISELRSTDNARWRDIMPESVTPTYSWLDLEGQWHTCWIGPTHEEAIMDGMPVDTAHWKVPESQHHAEFMTFLRNLPADTWLVHIDYHD